MEPQNEEALLTEITHWANRYRESRGRFEECLLVAYDAGVGPTAIAKAVGHLSEGGVRMLVKRRKTPTPIPSGGTEMDEHPNEMPGATA